MKVLELLAKLCAILAGVLMTVITLMTCASLIGRNTVGWTIVVTSNCRGPPPVPPLRCSCPGAVRRGNIIVDFFTAKASDSTSRQLDRFGSLLFGAALSLMAWRTAIGGLNAWTSQSTTMMMGFRNGWSTCSWCRHWCCVR